MDMTTTELELVAIPSQVAELHELELALVGGGIGDVILG